MKYRVFKPGRAAVAKVSALLLAGAALPAAEPAQAGGPKSSVDARYKISLNGFEIGDMHYVSAIEGSSYTLATDVELSLLLGAVHWKGASRTVGSLGEAAPTPTGFNFDFDSTMKSGSVRMGFDRGNVKSVAVEPQAPPAPDVVPVREQHLKGVLDPLSAIMVLTRGATANPCARKVGIFDGKQRFDLTLAYRRAESGGQTVCAVKYTPIAGFKKTEETANLAASTGIEITFKPAPAADLMVPSRIVLPTLAGTAEIVVEKVNVRGAGPGQVAQVD